MPETQSVSQCQALAEWRHGDVLGLDVGNVMSQSLENSQQTLHEYCDHGLYPFLVLYKLVFGLENLVIVSRVNAPIQQTTRPNQTPNPHHWVRRFLRHGLDLFTAGLPEENVILVNYYMEKGPAIRDFALGAFIDDRIESLISIKNSHPEAAIIKYDNNNPGCEARPLRPKWLKGNHFAIYCVDAAWRMNSWHELACAMGLPFIDDVFSEEYTAFFPPMKPALNSQRMAELIQHLRDKDTARRSTLVADADWVA